MVRVKMAVFLLN